VATIADASPDNLKTPFKKPRRRKVSQLSRQTASGFRRRRGVQSARDGWTDSLLKQYYRNDDNCTQLARPPKCPWSLRARFL